MGDDGETGYQGPQGPTGYQGNIIEVVLKWRIRICVWIFYFFPSIIHSIKTNTLEITFSVQNFHFLLII